MRSSEISSALILALAVYNIKIKTMTSQELFEQITAHYEVLQAEHAKTTKAAHSRARKAAGEIKKLITDYRKASTAEDKV